jgi:hypothetical protein
VSPEFEPAVREALAIYREVCGDTLAAAYVQGSVHRDEAVLGMSDLDMSAYVGVPLPPAARERFYQVTEARLARWAPLPRGVGYPGAPDWLRGAWLDRSEQERASAVLRWCQAREAGARPDAEAQERVQYVWHAFAFRHDATRMHGQDLLAGHPPLAPDALLARLLVRSPLEIVRLASQGLQDRERPLPKTPAARLRKLGRLAVLLGAGVLMARGRFRSLRGADVLPALERATPHWAAFLQETARCYVRVQPDAPPHEPYLRALADFAEWAWPDVVAAATV